MSKPKPTTRTDYAERILRVLLHIQHNLDRDLSLEELADIAHFSPFHFHRVFRGIVGESVMQYVRRLRLERAAHWLKHSDRPVTRIAFDTGYEAHEAFSRAFRAAFGCSPSEFRAAAAAEAARIDAPSGVHYVAAGMDMTFHPLMMEKSPMDVQVKTLQPMRVAFLRHVGPYEEVGETWEQLCGWAARNGLLGAETRFFGLSHDDPEVTPPEKIRYDACITVGEDVAGEGGIGVQTIEGGRFAMVLHEGSYDGFKDTYARLFGQWFAASEHEPAEGPSIEVYLNDPNSTEPEDLLTEIYVRIAE